MVPVEMTILKRCPDTKLDRSKPPGPAALDFCKLFGVGRSWGEADCLASGRDGSAQLTLAPECALGKSFSATIFVYESIQDDKRSHVELREVTALRAEARILRGMTAALKAAPFPSRFMR